ncbi:MAG: hypothetical protein ACRCXT_05575 [Paraclostridium sp.]
MSCNKNHRNNQLFSRLSDSQGGSGRHICCGCAYEQGFIDAFNNSLYCFRPQELPESQAGTLRHKNAEEAYDWGYKAGENSKK